ncbi:MAG: hypothetical protein ACRDD8_08360, partial [Bacteroidales bacterium]
SLEEFYCIISDSTISDDDRRFHDSVLVSYIFIKEDVKCNDAHLSNLMKLNVLSDTIQMRAELEFANRSSDKNRCLYYQNYIVRPSFINRDLTIYQINKSSVKCEPKYEVSFLYVNKRDHSVIDQRKLFKSDCVGLNELLQKYLLQYVNMERPESIDHVAVLKYFGFKNLDELGAVGVYDFSKKEMICYFNSGTIAPCTIDPIIIRIPLREVKPYLSKEFLKLL